MHHVLGALVIGALAGGGAIRRKAQLRKALLGAVKGGIIAKRKVQAVGAGAIAETQKLVDEARAELDRPAKDKATEQPS